MTEPRVAFALPRRIACVLQTLTLAQMPAVIPVALDEVWAFLGEHQVTSTGHNVCVYVPRGAPEGDLQFETYMGVEVHEELPETGRVFETDTPAGAVAVVTHWGPYDQLARVNADLRRWCIEHGLAVAGPCWEVYGDWSDDPAKLRTDIYCLLN